MRCCWSAAFTRSTSAPATTQRRWRPAPRGRGASLPAPGRSLSRGFSASAWARWGPFTPSGSGAGRSADGERRALLGGKGAGAAEMTRAGMPVPPGFTITTEACRAYLANRGKFPPGLWEQTTTALKTLERKTAKHFGDPENPLLVSVRSGAKFSMPGMMDTVLNLGLNEETTKGRAALTKDASFALDAGRRSIQMFGKTVMGIDGEKFEHAISEAKKRAGVKIGR